MHYHGTRHARLHHHGANAESLPGGMGAPINGPPPGGQVVDGWLTRGGGVVEGWWRDGAWAAEVWRDWAKHIQSMERVYSKAIPFSNCRCSVTLDSLLRNLAQCAL